MWCIIYTCYLYVKENKQKQPGSNIPLEASRGEIGGNIVMGKKLNRILLLAVWLAALFLMLWSGPAMACWTTSNLGCPGVVRVGTPFTCAPNYTSGSEGAVLWSFYLPSNMSSSGTSSQFCSYEMGMRGVCAFPSNWWNVKPNIPNGSSVSITATSAGGSRIGGLTNQGGGDYTSHGWQDIQAIPASPIYGTGCPSTAIVGQPFTCSPSYYTGYGPSISWSGANSVSGNSLTFASAGSKTVTLTTNYAGYANSLSQTITVINPTATITSLGCPSEAIVGTPFTCTPQASANVSGVTYTWSGDGVTASGDTLTPSTTGIKTIAYTATYPGVGIIGSGTQTVSVVSPTATITSLGCPTEAITGKAFTCTPQATANISTGVTYTWSGDDVTANGNNLTVSASGTKTITYTAIYPGSGTIGSGTQNIIVTTPSVTINSLGCPADAIQLTPFTCKPSVTSNIPASFAGGVTYTWSGDGVTADGNTLTPSTTGIKTITLTVNYPLVPHGSSSTQTVAVVSPIVTISSLGCPADAVPGKPVTCTPTVSANIPDSYKPGLTYAWSGDGVTADGNDLTFSIPGAKTVSLTANYPLVPVSGTATQDVNVVAPEITINSPGCPADALFLKAFTCAPSITTNLPASLQTGMTYTWTGADIHVSTGNSIAFSKDGTKTVNLVVSYPMANASKTATQDVNVVTPALQITSLGCPGNVVALNDFTCTPVIDTNVPEAFRAGATYKWSGNNLDITGNTLSAKNSGTKIITLEVEYPLATVMGVKSQTIAVSNPSATVTSLGCPAYTVVGKPFTCMPTIVPMFSANYREGATYTWSGDGLITNEDKSLTMTGPGGKTLTLTVNYPLVPSVTASKTQLVVAINPYVNVTSIGCPDTGLTTRSFTCTPRLSTNLPTNLKEGATYTWTGEGLQINEDGTMGFATAGAKVLQVVAKFPLADVEGSMAESIDIIEPQVQAQSVGCPTEAVTGKAFHCSPTITTNFPANFKSGMTYTWTGNDLTINGSNLILNTEGTKTVSLKVDYPLAAASTTMTQDIAVITGTAAITSLGCPTEVVTNEKFTCNPVTTTNLPASFQNGMTYTWSGVGLQTNSDGSLTFTEKGSPKDITLLIKYPLADLTATLAGQMVVGALNLTIDSLGCPNNLFSQTPFTCMPSITYDMPESYRNRLQYSWTGTNLVTSGSGEMAPLGSGNVELTLTVSIKDTTTTFKKTETLSASTRDPQITSLGCPESILATVPFTCTPVISAASQANYKFTWAGNDLQVGADGALIYPTGGDKPLVLSAINTETGVTLIYGTNVNVSAPVLKILSLGCPSSVRERKLFSCAPVIETNLPSTVTSELEYEWKGGDITAYEDGSLIYATPGSKSVSLSVSHPTRAGIKATKAASMNVRELAIKISYLGCPTTIIEYYPFSCIPAISIDSVTEESEITYEWKIDNEVVATTKKIENIIIPKNGPTSLTFTASIADPETAGELITATETITRDVKVNTSPLKLRLNIPRRVNAGSPATLAASTTFAKPEDVVYTWTIDGATYEGNQVTINTLDDRNSPIEYSITASIPTVETIKPETISGMLPVVPYAFPAVYFYGPMARATNIVPFTALFRLGVTNYSEVPLTYTWDFGDGTVLPETAELTKAMTHVYIKEGTYTATLTVKDDKGYSKQFSATVVAGYAPPRQISIRAYYSNATARAPLDVYCRYRIAEGLSVDVPIKNVWSVNGTPMSEKSIVTFNFANPGTYTLGLDVLTKYGNTASTTVPIVVTENVPPTCTINAKLITGKKYQLDAQCYDVDGRIVSYLWDFGDDTTGTSERDYREFKSGTYNIRVTATDNSGGTGTAETTLNVP
jgi:PKD repeat protein